MFISSRHIYVSLSTTVGVDPGVRVHPDRGGQSGGKVNLGVAKKIGELAARAAKAKGVEEVVFDRGGYNIWTRQGPGGCRPGRGLKF